MSDTIQEFKYRTEVIAAARALEMISPDDKRSYIKAHTKCNATKWVYAEYLADGDYSRISEFTPIAQAIHNEVKAEMEALRQKSTA